MAKISKTLIDLPDWFRPVRELAKCRYLSWDRESFAVSIELEARDPKPLQKHPILGDKPWMPAVKIHGDAIRSVAKDAQASEKKIAGMIAAFDRDQDWTRLILACRSEKDAFAQRAKAALAKASVKIQAVATKIWALEARKDPALAGARFVAVIDESVRPGSVGLSIGKLVVSQGGEVAPWQNAVKEAVKSCLELARQGRVLDKAEAELKADLTALVKETKEAARSGQTMLSSPPKVADTLKAARMRSAVVADAAVKAEKALCRALDASKSTLRDCKIKRVAEELQQSDKETAAMLAQVTTIASKCAAGKVLVTETEAALAAAVGAKDARGFERADKFLTDATAQAKKQLSANNGVWDDLSKLATRAMNAVVNVGKITTRHASQFKSKPGDIDVKIVS
ncbi:MAG: hypothetical protein AAFR17_01640 [Pseudomonadota bacterium]